MGIRSIRAVTMGLALLATVVTGAVAAPVSFNFTFASGGATAVGSITFESTLLSNPGANSFALPNPAVLALSVVVSGASAGNGSFGIGSFTSVSFNTNGATLNLSQNLIGQPTPGGPWGPGGGGDFNLFSAVAPAPRGVDPFILGANNGAADAMTLVQMAPPQASANLAIPALDDWTLVLMALLIGTAGIVLIRRGESRG